LTIILALPIDDIFDADAPATIINGTDLVLECEEVIECSILSGTNIFLSEMDNIVFDVEERHML